MGDFFKDLGAFIWAVINNWAGYATGGVIVALLWLWSTLKGIPVSRQVGIAVAFVFLFFAVFNAWREKHQQLLNLGARMASPEFRLEFGSTWWGPSSNNQRLMMIAGVSLINPHGPPSAAIHWGMQLEFEDKVAVAEFPPPAPGGMSIPLSGRAATERLVLKESDFLPLSTSRALEAGGSIGGWIQGVFREVSNDEIFAKKPNLVLYFSDAVSNSKHVFKQRLGEGHRGVKMPGE